MSGPEDRPDQHDWIVVQGIEEAPARVRPAPLARPQGLALAPEMAVAVIVSIAGGAVLAELGKDLYRQFRAVVNASYQRARVRWGSQKRQAIIDPLVVHVRYNTGRRVSFVFGPEMDDETLDRAIRAVLEAHTLVHKHTSERPVMMKFERRSDSWTELGS